MAKPKQYLTRQPKTAKPKSQRVRREWAKRAVFKADVSPKKMEGKLSKEKKAKMQIKLLLMKMTTNMSKIMNEIV